eukprot:TRINITY_DN5905_c0_g1_i4.p1 TRINITY_DN5905_c0_g1~~TRINITY_DN5905_c0_g1_i4.p1  ORF type:complete len:778 (+),score=116.35 TRINITY_DN5905_c0_g1_i4:512-2845(+)
MMHRQPIGLEEVITGKNNDKLRQFYKKWYHPALASVVVVGDIDSSACVEAVRKYFGCIPAAAPPPVVPSLTISESNSSGKCFFNWAGSDTPMVLLIGWKARVVNEQGFGDDESLLWFIIVTLLITLRLGNAEVSVADQETSGDKTRGPGNIETFALTLVDPKKNIIAKDFAGIVREVERLHRFGVFNEDVEYIRQALQPTLEAAVNSPNTSEEYLDTLVNVALGRTLCLLSRDTAIAMLHRVMAELSPEKVQAHFMRHFNWANCVVNVVGPKSLTTEIEKIFAETLSSTDIQPTGLNLALSDLRTTPFEALHRVPPRAQTEPGAKLSDDGRELLAVLPNGFRIHLAAGPSDILHWQLLTGTGFARKATSVSEETLIALTHAPEMVQATPLCGLSEAYTRSLRISLGSTDAISAPNVTGFKGETPIANAETLVQWLHLLLTEKIEIDKKVWQEFCSGLKAAATMELPAEQLLEDAIVDISFEGHPVARRVCSCTPRFRRAPSKADVEFFVTEEFQDPAECQFSAVLPGSQVIGLLKVLNDYFHVMRPREIPVPPSPPVTIPFALQVARKDIVRGSNLHALVAISVPLPELPESTQHAELRAPALATLLQHRLRDAMREREGLVYTISVNPFTSLHPYALRLLQVRFACNPTHIKSNIARCINEMRLLHVQGASERELHAVRQIARQATLQQSQDPEGQLKMMSTNSCISAPILLEDELPTVTKDLTFSVYTVVTLVPGKSEPPDRSPIPRNPALWIVAGTIFIGALAFAVPRLRNRAR